MKYIILGILIILISAIVPVILKQSTAKSAEPAENEPIQKETISQNRNLSRSELVSKKTGLPHHIMLEHLVKGIIITPSQGDELPTVETISKFENQIDWTFPSEYKDFQLKFGALFMQVDEKIWTTPKTGDVVPFWATNYGYIIYGFAKDCPDEFDIQRKFYQFKDVFPELPFFMPIHRRVAGDQTYVGFDIDGNLVTAHQHENRLAPLNMDFDSFVKSEAADLEIRMKRRIEYNKTGEWPKF